MFKNKIQLKFLFLLPLVFVTLRATPSDYDSENQCRLEVRCDGNKKSPSVPSNHDDNRPLAIGKAGPKGLPGQKGEPGTSCTARDCLAQTAEFEAQILQLSSCLIENITNADHNASSLIRHNEAVTYECVSGYFTKSIKTRRCFMGRLVPSLYLYPLVCIQGCLVTNINHTSSDAPQGTYVRSNTSITYSCDAGYTTSDVVERTCRGSEITPSFEEEPLVCHADCTSVDQNFDRGTVQLPLVHGEKAVITCDPGYVTYAKDIFCRDGLVDLRFVYCKRYRYVNKQLSWLKSQQYCQDVFQGSLASYGLETIAARKNIISRFNIKTDFSIGMRRVNGTWVRVDGSKIVPPLDFIWYPGHGQLNEDYMRVSLYKQSLIGTLVDRHESLQRVFVCEN